MDVISMDLNKFIIENNTLLIIPNNIKNKVIKELSNNGTLLNIKIMSIEEFRNKLYFSYDEKSIYYLMNKYGYKYSIAREYLNNLYYVGDYDNEKLIFLRKIRRTKVNLKRYITTTGKQNLIIV